MSGMRSLTQRALGKVDARYHRAHELVAMGPILLVGRRRYTDPDRLFPDGTLLRCGDTIGELHFHNTRVLKALENNSQRAALDFARAFRLSLGSLATCVATQPDYSQLRVYHGLSWLRPHGAGIGFIAERVPASVERYCRIAYFRLLLWAFAPVDHERQRPQPDPHHFWLTRQALRRKFAAPQRYPSEVSV